MDDNSMAAIFGVIILIGIVAIVYLISQRDVKMKELDVKNYTNTVSILNVNK